MNKKRLIVLGATLFLVLLPVTPVLADDGPPDDGTVVWGEDYTVEEGEVLEGDLVVFNGNVTVETGGRVEGSIVVWSGNAEIDGTITGDLVVSSGNIHLGEAALIEGQVVCSWNCDLDQEEGAEVEGGIVEGTPLQGIRVRRWGNFPIPSTPIISIPGPGLIVSKSLQVVRVVVSVLLAGAIAGLVALMWPDQVTRVSQTIARAPIPSLGIGLLTVIGVATIIILLVLTVCVPVVGLLALVGAGLFGWIGVGALVGERLMQALKAREITPLWSAGAGTLVISLIAAGLDLFPCLDVLGWLVILITGSIGLGAVVLTRFGTQPYERSALEPEAAYAPIPPEPEPVAAPEAVEKPRRKRAKDQEREVGTD